MYASMQTNANVYEKTVKNYNSLLRKRAIVGILWLIIHRLFNENDEKSRLNMK